MTTAAIADRAVEIIGRADPAQYETAFATMSVETTTVTKPANWESELAVMSRLGIVAAETTLSKIEGYLTSQGLDRVVRMIRSERGLNLADPQTIGLVQNLAAAGVLTSEEATNLLESNTETVLRWPGLTRGQVSDALRLRAAGDI